MLHDVCSIIFFAEKYQPSRKRLLGKLYKGTGTKEVRGIVAFVGVTFSDPLMADCRHLTSLLGANEDRELQHFFLLNRACVFK